MTFDCVLPATRKLMEGIDPWVRIAMLRELTAEAVLEIAKESERSTHELMDYLASMLEYSVKAMEEREKRNEIV